MALVHFHRIRPYTVPDRYAVRIRWAIYIACSCYMHLRVVVPSVHYYRSVQLARLPQVQRLLIRLLMVNHIRSRMVILTAPTLTPLITVAVLVHILVKSVLSVSRVTMINVRVARSRSVFCINAERHLRMGENVSVGDLSRSKIQIVAVQIFASKRVNIIYHRIRVQPKKHHPQQHPQ